MLRSPAILVLALLLSPVPARADELTEFSGERREARLSSLAEIRKNINQPARVETSAAKAAEDAREADELIGTLERRIAELRGPMDRLRSLRGGYPEAADLGRVDGERAELRRVLGEGEREFSEKIPVVESLRRRRITAELQAVIATGAKGAGIDHLGNAVRVERETEDVREFKFRLREALEEDEQAYALRRDVLEAARARGRAARIAGLAGGAALLALGGAGLWALRRRRRPAKPAELGGIVGGNYRLERELGRGGIGVVYEASDLGLRRKVAVKRLRPELKQSPRDLEAFLKEARLVAGLKHTNIVEIYSIVDDASGLHLVFELVEGRPLSAALQASGRLPLDAVLSIARQVGSALDFAHSQGVIHRDLKPHCIMFAADGTAKVTEFGLAYRAGETIARLTRASSWGTPAYMAPEQELGTIARESDLYSLGVILYELLTGKLPFRGPDLLAEKRSPAFPPASRAAPGLPPWVDEALSKALQPDPARRFHAAAELVRALEAA